MIRLLDTRETDITRIAWPNAFSDSYTIPPDGIIKYIDEVGCVFVFVKTTGERLYILVTDIWSNCSRQELPAPEGLWESIVNELIQVIPSARTFKLLLWIMTGGIVLILLQREGFLKGSASG